MTSPAEEEEKEAAGDDEAEGCHEEGWQGFDDDSDGEVGGAPGQVESSEGSHQKGGGCGVS